MFSCFVIAFRVRHSSSRHHCVTNTRESQISLTLKGIFFLNFPDLSQNFSDPAQNSHFSLTMQLQPCPLCPQSGHFQGRITISLTPYRCLIHNFIKHLTNLGYQDYITVPFFGVQLKFFFYRHNTYTRSFCSE